MAELFIPKAQDNVTPLLNLVQLKQQQEKFKQEQAAFPTLQKFREEQILTEQMSQIQKAAAVDPEAAVKMFNSNPLLVERSGGTVTYKGDNGSDQLFQIGNKIVGVTKATGESKVLFEGEKADSEQFTLSPGQTRFSGEGKEIAAVPKEEPFSLSPGQTRFDPQGKPVASVADTPSSATGTLSWVGTDQETNRPILMNNKTGTLSLGDLPKDVDKIGTKVSKPMPQFAQNSLSGAISTLDSIKDIEQNIGESGRFEGLLSKGQVFVGANQKAIKFDNAVKNLINQAQSLIKGIPSNFDVENFKNTLPELGLPEDVNKDRLVRTKAMAKQLIIDSISYFKGEGYKIPQSVLANARRFGINVDGISARDPNIEADPLANAAALLDEQQSIPNIISIRKVR